MFRAAVDAGAEVLMPVEDCFWGDRYGILKDPFGHRWSVATRLKDLSPAQLQRRASEYCEEQRSE
jgi:PhnB protein